MTSGYTHLVTNSRKQSHPEGLTVSTKLGKGKVKVIYGELRYSSIYF